MHSRVLPTRNKTSGYIMKGFVLATLPHLFHSKVLINDLKTCSVFFSQMFIFGRLNFFYIEGKKEKVEIEHNLAKFIQF